MSETSVRWETLAETSSYLSDTANAEARRAKGKLSVCVVGGGPVGLAFAAQLRTEMGQSIDVTVCDGRWKQTDGHIAWMNAEDGVNRREQVVTLQSGVLRHLASSVYDALFPQGGFTQVWPICGESPTEFGFPLNVRIRDIEDRLLTYNIAIGTRMEARRVSPEELDGRAYDLVVIADGPRSRNREHFAGRFGAADIMPYSVEGQQVEDTVLGLRVTTRMQPADQVIMTVAQQRFLMNVSNGEGYLYMRLTPEEAREVRGRDPRGTSFTSCVQSSPCMMRARTDGSFHCTTHGTVFAPPEDPNSFLWPRVREGLALFDVAPGNLHAITAFRLSMESRPRFTAEITPTGSEHPVFGALLGDAANAIHFWPGRGLNHGLSSAVSLVNTLMASDPSRGLRSADFTRHEATMHALQHRHKDRAWRNMVVARGGLTVSIADRIAELLDVQKTSRCHAKSVLVGRLRALADRLAPRLPDTPNTAALLTRLDRLEDATLTMFAEVGPWEMRLSGGPEVDIAALNPKPVKKC